MVSFWFQGELVFHAPGDRASYQLFLTFFESLNHSGEENIAFGNGRKFTFLLLFTHLAVQCAFCSCAIEGDGMICKRNRTAHT